MTDSLIADKIKEWESELQRVLGFYTESDRIPQLCKKAISDLEQLREQKPDAVLRWVKASERLPESESENKSVDCLCYDEWHKQIRVLSFNPYHNCWDDESGDDYYTDAVGGKVTHWQPLPQKPNSEESKPEELNKPNEEGFIGSY